MTTKKSKPNATGPDGNSTSQTLLKPAKKTSIGARIRTYFLTGLVVAAPIGITLYLTRWFVEVVDEWFMPLIPEAYRPENYLSISIPGLGLLVALVVLTLLGALTANFFGRQVLSLGERIVERMPVVRTVYGALKQIFETVLAQSTTSFRDVGLIEYPRKGLYALVFVTTATKGEVASRVPDGTELVSVFLPTTPNPTSGFLLFVPKTDIQILDMSVEEAAKLVISAGLVVPGEAEPAEVSGKKLSNPVAEA